MGDVEFLDPGPEPAGDPDVLAAGPRQPVPRWVIALTGLGVVAAVVLALTLGGGTAPSAAPSAVPSAVPSALRSAPPVLNLPGPVRGLVGAPLQLGLPIGTQVIDIALGPHTLYALSYGYSPSSGNLVALAPLTGAVLGRGDVDIGNVTPTGTGLVRLFASGDTVWVVAEGVAPPAVQALDARTLRPDRTVVAPGTIEGGAVLNGVLYLATAAGIAAVAPGATQVTALPGYRGFVSAITADPQRNRLIALDAQSPAHLLVADPDGPTRVVRAIGPFAAGSLAVSAGQIWLAGSDATGQLLTRLDPVSLREVDEGPGPGPVGGLAIDLAAGARALLVSGRTDGVQVWCVDPTSGRVRASWAGQLHAVRGGAGAVYALRDGQVVRLRAGDACPV